MKNFKDFIRVYLPLIVGIIVTGISLVILQAYMGMKPQVYKDVILEAVALTGVNKTGEVYSVWISIFLGIISILVYLFLKKENIKKLKNIKIQNFDFLGIGVFLIPIISILILKQEINIFYLIAGIIYFISPFFVKNKKISKEKILLLLFSVYFFCLSLKAVFDKLSKNFEIIPQDILYLLTGIIFFSILYFLERNKKLDINKTIMKLQLPVPFILLTYLTNRYLIDEIEIHRIPYSKRYILLIILLIVILLVIGILQYKKKLKKIDKKENIFPILFPSIIILSILRQFIFPMFVHNGDFWHLGEEMLPWDQLFKQKMTLFGDFSGTSGFYGMTLGFLQNIILKGTDISYYPAYSLRIMLWCILLAVLIYLLVGEKYSLIIFTFTSLTIYNRIYLLLASLLILSIPRLIKRRVNWLQIYGLLSILSVFYYPLNGAGVVLGGLPFALIQMYLVIKERLIIKSLKQKMFWVLNIVLIYPVVIMIKYTSGLVKMMKLLSSQTVPADGINVYGYSNPPGWFMRYIIDYRLKNVAWYVSVFLAISFILLIFMYYLFLYLMQDKKLMKKLKCPEFFILSSACIAIPLNYTYMIVRMEWVEGLQFFRQSNAIIAFGFILLVFICRYGHKLFNKNIKTITIGLILVYLILIKGDVPLGNEVNYVQHTYKISNMVYVDGNQEGIPKLGKGIISEKNMKYIRTYKEMKEKLIKENERFWPIYSREMLIIFNSKTPTKIDSPVLTKSLRSTRENLSSIKEKPVFITDLTNWGSYYTYRWVIENGYVLYKYKDVDFWIRPDRYAEVFGSLEEGRKNIFNDFETQSFDRIPYSLGNSMKSLSKIFKNRNEINLSTLKFDVNQIEYLSNEKFKIIDKEKNMKDKMGPYIVLNLPNVINGSEYDFMYIEFESNDKKTGNRGIEDKKKIQLLWEDEQHTISENRSIWFNVMNGKLLIPVGMHAAWNFSNITKLKINFEGLESGTEIKIKKIEFMKLDTDRKED